MDIFTIQVVQAIIFFQWKYFKRTIIWKVLVPFLVYFVLFVVYGSLMLQNSEEEGWGPWSIGSLVICILILIMAAYMAYIEVEQLRFHGLEYFRSFWNLVDLISLVLNLVTIICDFAGLRTVDVATLAAIAVLFMWLKVFYFLRIFNTTASMVRMIVEITSDMKYFLMVLMMAVFAFANAFYILNVGEPDMAQLFPYSLVFSYRMGLGDFITDEFGGSKDEILVWVMWFVNTLIINIILLNLLIAIMGDTFDRVQETTEASMLKEITGTMQENEFLFNRERTWKEARYIIIVQSEQAENAAPSWEGRLAAMKRLIEDKAKEQKVDARRIEKKFEHIDDRIKGLQHRMTVKLSTVDNAVGRVGHVATRADQKIEQVFSLVKQLNEAIT